MSSAASNCSLFVAPSNSATTKPGGAGIAVTAVAVLGSIFRSWPEERRFRGIALRIEHHDFHGVGKTGFGLEFLDTLQRFGVGSVVSF